jgi:ATP-dependent DNA ligase
MFPNFPPKLSPIIPVRRRNIFDSPDWVYEVKHDGFRALAYLEDGQRRLVSRRGNAMKRFDDFVLCDRQRTESHKRGR